jgi:hypothetical protein
MRSFLIALLAIPLLALGLSSCDTPNGNPPKPGGGSWNEVFSDEFNGTALDRTVWQPNWLGASDTAITPPVNSHENACYDPAEVSEHDGSLWLKVVASSCTVNGHTYGYRAGLVNTAKSHTISGTYYIEWRAYSPSFGSSVVNWPGVWDDGTGTWPSTGESDVYEGLSGNACWHYHSPSGGPGGCVDGSKAAGWHTFGELVYGNGTVDYYYDGAPVGEITNAVNAAHFLVAVYSVGSDGGPIAAGQSMQIDDVRVWN